MTVPACGLYYHFRVKILQPYIDDKQAAKRAAAESSRADKATSVLSRPPREPSGWDQGTTTVASPLELTAAAEDAATIYLDVRSGTEVAATPPLPRPSIKIPVTLADTSGLAASKGKLPAAKGSPIVVFCASGRRATAAKAALESAGYTRVLVGGGHSSVLASLPTVSPPASSATEDGAASISAPPRRKWLGLF